MLNYRNGSDTLIVVLHEIYGINGHITGVCEKLAEQGYDVACPDLLDGRVPFEYEKREDAYRYFMNFIGLESAAKRATFLVRQEEENYQNIILLGYSVGATVAWLCGTTTPLREEDEQYGGNLIKCSGMICYYGSRIRDYTKVTLNCPALLLFGEKEQSFQPEVLKKELEDMDLAEVQILPGGHGFADPYSMNYRRASAAEAERAAGEFISRIRRKNV